MALRYGSAVYGHDTSERRGAYEDEPVDFIIAVLS